MVQTTHIKNISVFFHPMEQIEVVSGKFNMVTTTAEFPRLESEMSFLQVRATMTLQETIRQVKAEICENRKQVAHTRLESIDGVENPYSLMQVFGRGHQVTRNRGTVYVTRCQAMDVFPRTHTNCTNEIPAILNGTNMFVDLIAAGLNDTGGKFATGINDTGGKFVTCFASVVDIGGKFSPIYCHLCQRRRWQTMGAIIKLLTT